MLVALACDRFRFSVFIENALAHHYRGRAYEMVIVDKSLLVIMREDRNQSLVGRHTATGGAGFDFDLFDTDLPRFVPCFGKHHLEAEELPDDSFTVAMPPPHELPWPAIRYGRGLAADPLRVANDIERRIRSRKGAGILGCMIVPSRIADACDAIRWKYLVSTKTVMIEPDVNAMTPAQRARYREAQKSCCLV